MVGPIYVLAVAWLFGNQAGQFLPWDGKWLILTKDPFFQKVSTWHFQIISGNSTDKTWLNSLSFVQQINNRDGVSYDNLGGQDTWVDLGLNWTSRPVRKSDKFWNVRIPDFQFFPFPDAGLFKHW